MTGMTLAQFSPTRLLEMGVEKLESISARLGIYAVASFAAVLLWLAFLGFAGMHLIRLFSAVGAAGVGFYTGCVGFVFLRSKVDFVGLMPDFVVYVVGMLLALGLFYLAWRMCVPFAFLMLGAGGGFVSYLLLNHWIVGVLIGVALMVAAYFCFVFTVILGTGCIAGVGSTIMLGLMFPNAAVLHPFTGSGAILVALGISAFFVLVQWVTTPNYRKFGV